MRNFTHAWRRSWRRGQAGQSLIILALGFIALIGFVGIVTDVSLLFVRYSSLRRAVDAAAVAAAGQFRRVADDTTPLPGLDGTLGTADDLITLTGDAASVAQLSLAARQFIEIYGLDPQNVLVETCRAQRVNRDPLGNPQFLTPAPDEEEELYYELCTNEELKLVRVTAQIDSPTVFLRLLGQPSVTLTESAISQTAVIDVVLIFDVSESMLNETTYDTWVTESGGVYDNIYLPPVIGLSDEAKWPLLLGGNHNNHQIDFATLQYSDPTNGALVPPDYFTGATARGYYNFEPDGTLSTSDPLRTECRWFAWPSTTWNINSVVPNDLLARYQSFLPAADLRAHFNNGNIAAGDPSPWRFYGFQPTYNYYGCCNDPNGDMSFDDLVCQPFKDARDAAEEFLDRLDFLRGDRVAFVTFDRSAQIIDPDGTRPQPAIIETQRTLDPDGPGPRTVGDPQYREGALEVLRRAIGVRTESNFYVDTDTNPDPNIIENDGRWDGLNDFSRTRSYADFNNAMTRSIFDFPVANACPFDQATMVPRYTGFTTLPDGSPAPNTYRLMRSIVTTPWWFNDDSPTPSETAIIRRSYEYRASCSGTNIGGALAAGSNTLFNAGRREGAVWMMVLLSDGAAGASNPVIRTSGPDGTPDTDDDELAAGAQPFIQTAGLNTPLRGTPPDLTDTTTPDLINPPAGYGSFGVCPYGVDTQRAELLLNADFPFCGDLLPPTRHFCYNLAIVPDRQPLEVYANCIERYDVDDYSRDWADWVGLANLNAVGSGGTSRTGEELLPTIFTIGFGLRFANTTGCPADTPANDNRVRWDCLRTNNVPDYLGEELLRYIADVGDNFQMDDDFWQAYDGYPASSPVYSRPDLYPNRLPNGVPDPLDPNADWGPRNPCQLTLQSAVAEGYTNRYEYAPIAPTADCGNYFNAPTGAELNAVFNEIASRMFTRLTQ
jgi:hypothetical protein